MSRSEKFVTVIVSGLLIVGVLAALNLATALFILHRMEAL